MSGADRALARIDLEGVEPTCLWHPYSDGHVERDRLGAWREAFRHPHWNPHTRWRVETDETGRTVLAVQHADAFLITGEPTWADYTVTAGVRQYFPFNINPSVNLGYRQDCLSGVAARLRDVRSYYFYCLENHAGLVLYRVEDDNLIVLAREWVAVDRARHHELRLDCRGDRLTCFFDGRPAFRVRDGSYPAGPCGLRTNSKAAFVGVEVTVDAEAAATNAARRAAGEATLAERRRAHAQPVLETELPQPLGRPGRLQLRRVEAERAWGFFWIADPAASGRPAAVAACSLDGEVRWQREIDPPPSGAVVPKSYDVDQDGTDDLLLACGSRLCVLCGRTGQPLADVPFPLAGPLMGTPGQTAPIGYAYAPQFRRPPAPRDLLLLDGDSGGGLNAWCYDLAGCLRWHTTLPFRFGHNMYFADVDGDGCEEAMLGHCLVRGDGTLVWAVEEMRYEPLGAMGIHADSVVLGDLTGDGSLRLASVAGDDGVLFADGTTGKLLNRRRIGHAQGISAARYVRDVPGLQVLAGTRHRAYGIFVLFDGHGQPLHRWQPDLVNQNGTPVNWEGDGEELLLLLSPDSGRGLFDWQGRLVVPFTGPLATAHLVAAQPVGADPRDRLIAQHGDRIAIFGPARDPCPVDGRLYAPRREYWRGHTLGVVSHAHWAAA